MRPLHHSQPMNFSAHLCTVWEYANGTFILSLVLKDDVNKYRGSVIPKYPPNVCSGTLALDKVFFMFSPCPTFPLVLFFYRVLRWLILDSRPMTNKCHVPLQ